METLAAKTTLDRRGKTISTFVVFDVATHMDAMSEGETIEVLTDDYGPLQRDISAWCQTTGHVLVSSEQVTTGWRFLIEKRIPAAKDTKMAMVISPDGLEELLSPLGFALAAALEGIDVSLYVQGPAVRVLGRGFRPKLKGWARPFSRFAAAQMSEADDGAPSRSHSVPMGTCSQAWRRHLPKPWTMSTGARHHYPRPRCAQSRHKPDRNGLPATGAAEADRVRATSREPSLG